MFRDPLHGQSWDQTTWSRTNAAEAIPGVVSPLGWTVWGPSAESAVRQTFHALGTLPKRDAALPVRDEDRLLNVFFGRPALNCDFFRLMGDRLPGTTGPEAAGQVLGSSIQRDFLSHPEPRYYALVAIRLPVTALTSPRLARRARATTDIWWRGQLVAMPRVTRDEAVSRFTAAVARFADNVHYQARCVYSVVQPVYTQLLRIAERAGVNGDRLVAGHGSHEELDMVKDLWECSRGRLDLSAFITRHGYHGPREGELSSKVWREEPGPLLQILDGYRAMDEAANPVDAERERSARRVELEREFLAALPPSRRPAGRAVIALAARCLPLRSMAKMAFLQSLDVTRAAARRLGECLELEGALDHAEDVFFLTADEIARSAWAGARERVHYRRSRFEEYQAVDIPIAWQGMPAPLSVAVDQSITGIPSLEGVAASPGIVEGRVRVVTDPSDATVEPGDIVVAHTTDPSWAAVLFLSSALVMDIGGLLSHAAVVARELGIPCVAGTGIGTRALRTGDWCRVDGTSGRVEVLAEPSGQRRSRADHALD